MCAFGLTGVKIAFADVICTSPPSDPPSVLFSGAKSGEASELRNFGKHSEQQIRRRTNGVTRGAARSSNLYKLTYPVGDEVLLTVFKLFHCSNVQGDRVKRYPERENLPCSLLTADRPIDPYQGYVSFRHSVASLLCHGICQNQVE